jgi:glycerol-3-phosphate O-acyltransferase
VVRAAGTRDIYRLLRAPAEVLTVPAAAVEAGVARLVARIAADPAYGHVHSQLAVLTPAAIVDDAVRGLGSYHSRPVVDRRGDDIVVGDVKLLYYYQNRTHHIPVEAVAAVAAGPGRRAATVDA